MLTPKPEWERKPSFPAQGTLSPHHWISLKLMFGPPLVWTGLYIGTYKTSGLVPQNVEAQSLVCEAVNKALHKCRQHGTLL